jgi:hypothetical protein
VPFFVGIGHLHPDAATTVERPIGHGDARTAPL